MKKSSYLYLLILCISVGTFSYAAVRHILLKDINKIETKNVKEDNIKEDNLKAKIQAVSVEVEPRVQPSTKMVYEYYYPEDGITKEQEDVPPYFLLDLSMKELQKMYEDWKIISFSEKEVVMRRTMAGKSDERYVISQKDGYIAVFYEEEQNGVSLHEVTNTPVASLPEEEQERLNNGISVLGDDTLSKVLSDYGS